MDPRIPIQYAAGGDVLPIAAMVQRMGQGGWFLNFPNLGAPFGADWSDYAFTDVLHWFTLYPIAWVTPTFGAAINVFYVAGYPLVALGALAVLRHFRIAWPPAFAASILYAMLPYHFGRSTHHLTLGAYYLVPAGVMVALWVAEGRALVSLERWRIHVHKPYGRVALAVCILAGLQGVYYGIFAAFLIGVAGLIAVSKRQPRGTLVAPCFYGMAIAGMLVVSTLPVQVSKLRNGPNPEAIQRDAFGPELYSLRITQLLLPATGHRIPFLASGKAAYNRVMGIWSNENDLAALGVVGAAGFMLLVGALLWRSHGLTGELALLNISAILLAEASGLGCFAALALGGWIRAYNRISVYIAFMALLAGAHGVTMLYRRVQGSGWAMPFLVVGCAAVLLGGVFDQTTAGSTPNYARDREFYAADRQFVREIEAAAPARSMIFQLPYMPFPEAGPVNAMMDYNPVRPYLHSATLRWSYGAMRGRPADLWYRRVAGLNPDAMVEQLALANFAGIYVDRLGYTDRGVKLERELALATGGSPLVHRDARASFFSLAPVRARLGAGRSPGELR